MGKWRTTAQKIIGAAYQEAKNSGVRGRAVRRFINQRYSQYAVNRKKYPYRVWLEELDRVMYGELFGTAQLSLGF